MVKNNLKPNVKILVSQKMGKMRENVRFFCMILSYRKIKK